MKRNFILPCLLFAAILLFTGCSMNTIDQMYCLPKRSESYMNLQSAIDHAMGGLEYHAPISGENQQPVQMVDLNGDGITECIVFAKGVDEKPLKVLIFTCEDDKYTLSDKIESTGNAFDKVNYIPFEDNQGLDMVIGRQVSDQVLRPVSVYTMRNGTMEQLLTAHYSRIVCADMDENGQSEILILRPDDDLSHNGVAELYGMKNGIIERSNEIAMSRPADQIKRIMTSRLNDGTIAVFVASDVDGSAIITDVYALLEQGFHNVSLSNESGTSVQTLRNYYVYADDIDKDGVLELPDLIPLPSVSPQPVENQYLIRWYAMNPDGSEVNKRYTYHSFTGGWYLELPDELASTVTVSQLGNSYVFSAIGADQTLTNLMTLYIFTGQGREEQAVLGNRFVLHRTEYAVYAAHLEVASVAYHITQNSLKDGFHMITQDLLNGEF